MTEQTYSRTHTLKVHDIGDHYRKQVKLKVALEGMWLKDAGYQAGQYVKVVNPSPGVLIITCLEAQV